eukprot:scaffold48881_cov62-Attheya_sp.AAC.7
MEGESSNLAAAMDMDMDHDNFADFEKKAVYFLLRRQCIVQPLGQSTWNLQSKMIFHLPHLVLSSNLRLEY